MNSKDAIIFETARASVQRYKAATQRRALAADPDVIRFSHWPDREDDAFAASVTAMQRRHPLDGGGWMNLAIMLKAGGYAGDHAILVEAATAKLGIALLPALRGTGLAAEVIAGSLAMLRGHHVSRFQAEIDPDNATSLAVFERAGFERVRLDADDLGPFWALERT